MVYTAGLFLLCLVCVFVILFAVVVASFIVCGWLRWCLLVVWCLWRFLASGCWLMNVCDCVLAVGGLGIWLPLVVGFSAVTGC